jgi:hypothetical protein
VAPVLPPDPLRAGDDRTGGCVALHRDLAEIDRRIRLVVERQRSELVRRASDPFRGLCISDADVDDLPAQRPHADLTQTETGGPGPRLQRLVDLFELSAFGRDVILICLAPDIDLRYERLYAYLQDDVTRRRPTVDLVLRLLEPADLRSARAAIGSGGRLQSQGMLELADESAGRARSWHGRSGWMVEYLLEWLSICWARTSWIRGYLDWQSCTNQETPRASSASRRRNC